MQEDPNEKVFGLICKHICNLNLQSVDTCGSLGCTLGNSRDTVKAKIVLLKGIVESMDIKQSPCVLEGCRNQTTKIVHKKFADTKIAKPRAFRVDILSLSSI